MVWHGKRQNHCTLARCVRLVVILFFPTEMAAPSRRPKGANKISALKARLALKKKSTFSHIFTHFFQHLSCVCHQPCVSSSTHYVVLAPLALCPYDRCPCSTAHLTALVCSHCRTAQDCPSGMLSFCFLFDTEEAQEQPSG